MFQRACSELTNGGLAGSIIESSAIRAAPRMPMRRGSLRWVLVASFVTPTDSHPQLLARVWAASHRLS